MFRHTRKGSITVEAAIILPIVIIGILTVGCLIKVNCINENVIHAALDETRLLAIESYTDVGKLSIVNFSSNLKKRIQNENQNINHVEIEDLKYLYSYGEMDKLICFNAVYDIDFGLPIDFYGNITGCETIVCRAFVGSDKYGEIITAQEMEKEEESELVWIFPNSGKKYHKKTCPYISIAASQMILNDNLRGQYEPCKICNPDTLVNGSIVYCFKNSGHVYHKASCYMVDRYVIEIEKSEAIERNYTPCLKCGG